MFALIKKGLGDLPGACGVTGYFAHSLIEYIYACCFDIYLCTYTASLPSAWLYLRNRTAKSSVSLSKTLPTPALSSAPKSLIPAQDHRDNPLPVKYPTFFLIAMGGYEWTSLFLNAAFCLYCVLCFLVLAAPPWPLRHQLILLGLISKCPALSLFEAKRLDVISPVRKDAFGP